MLKSSLKQHISTKKSFKSMQSKCANKEEVNVYPRSFSFNGFEVDRSKVFTFCIANATKTSVKFECSSDAIKSVLKFTPSKGKLSHSKAVNIEVSVIPLCTYEIHEKVKIDVTHNDSSETFFVEINGNVNNSYFYDDTQFEEGEFIEVNHFVDFMWKGILNNKGVFIDGRNDRSKEQLDNEINVYRSINSPLVLSFIGACQIPKHKCIITNATKFGNLYNAICFKDKPSEYVRIKLCSDMARAIFYLHENGIIHNEIDPKNVYITRLSECVEYNAKLGGLYNSTSYNFHKRNEEYFDGVKSDLKQFSILMQQIMSWNINCSTNPREHRYVSSLSSSDGSQITEIAVKYYNYDEKICNEQELMQQLRMLIRYK